jgi:tripartite-type tricarboxylate transporter receptor subunit TctC
MNRRSLLALAATGLATPHLLHAQEAWPERPIRLIVPWPPGGSTDTIARLFQPKLAEILGRPVIIDNRGGASGSIGAIEASRAAPDGYTWMFAYDNEATNQTLMRLPYKTLEAFAPISLVATGPLALVAHSSTPYRSFKDVVAAAKAAPDTISFASSGVGGLAHVSTTLLQQQGGFSLVHVPYRGGGPAVQDAVAGQVPLFMSNVVIISQHIRAGTLRPLGVTTLKESRHVPGTEPFAEQGFAGFDAPTWWASSVATGTPEPISGGMQRR